MGPAFIRQPAEGEHQWVGDSTLPRDEQPAGEHSRQGSEDLWNIPPLQRNTFSWASPRQERLQMQCQASAQDTLPEPPTEGPPPLRRTGHAQQQRQLPDNIYGSNPVNTEILTDAAW